MIFTYVLLPRRLADFDKYFALMEFPLPPMENATLWFSNNITLEFSLYKHRTHMFQARGDNVGPCEQVWIGSVVMPSHK